MKQKPQNSKITFAREAEKLLAKQIVGSKQARESFMYKISEISPQDDSVYEEISLGRLFSLNKKTFV